MRLFCPLIGLCIATALGHLHADEPPMDSLVLADGDSGSVWVSAEATMQPDATHSREGRAMRFHIDVDHFEGEPNYPIGWPRTYLPISEELRDWSSWDFVEFWIYADTSRENLPLTPIGIIIRCPDRNSSFGMTLSEVSKGDWAQYRIPVADLPNPADVTAVQFHIAESNYNHGDVLDFWIDDLVLLRYAEPTVITMQPLSFAQYADAPVLRVEVGLTGMDEGETAEVLTRLVRDGTTVRQSSATLGPGVHTIPLEFGADLAPGSYQVQAQIAGTERVLSDRMRVISSPWEGEAP